MPCPRQGVCGASLLPGHETTACTTGAVQPLAQAVTVTHVCSFVDRDMFMRHFGHGVGHQQYRWQQEDDATIKIEADLDGDNDNIEELDEHKEEIDSDKEFEGRRSLLVRVTMMMAVTMGVRVMI